MAVTPLQPNTASGFDAASTFTDSLKQTYAAAALLNRENQALLQQLQMLKRQIDALEDQSGVQARLIHSQHDLSRSNAVIKKLQTQLRQLKQSQTQNLSLIRELSLKQSDENTILLQIREHSRQLAFSDFLRWVWATYPPPRSRHDVGQLEGSKLLNMVRLAYHPDRLMDVNPGYKTICQEITKMINDNNE